MQHTFVIRLKYILEVGHIQKALARLMLWSLGAILGEVLCWLNTV